MPAPPAPVTAHIALGSNIGDRAANLNAARDRLRATPGIRVAAVSSFLDNPAVGGPTNSPPYLNAAATVETTLPPDHLLRRLLAIEVEMGRVRRRKWEPRVIDLDLLLYGSLVIDTPELKVPHPLLHERDFVLKPLAEIAPDAFHPVSLRSVADLLSRLTGPAEPSANLLRDRDLPCGNCGYNLRTLAPWQQCPECGTPVVETLRQAALGLLPGARGDAGFYRRALLAPVAERLGYPVDGLLFVMDAVTHEAPDRDGNVTAAGACRGVHAYVHTYFNNMAEARDLLTEWKVCRSEDVGRIVFALAGAGMLRVERDQTPSDFDNVYTPEALFEKPAGD